MLALAAFLLLSTSAAPRDTTPQYTAIVNGTLVDVAHNGHSTADIEHAIVLIANGRVVVAGDRAHVRIPAHARVIDAAGRYIIPGLIDGYGALRTQKFADAYLYEGVTTVIIPIVPDSAHVDGETSFVAPANGLSVLTGAPISGYDPTGDVPHTSPWSDHKRNDRRLDSAMLTAEVDSAAARGARIINIGLDVWPEQLDVIVAEAHRKQMAVTAQVAFTNYPYAVSHGVDVLIRNDKYSLALSHPRDFAAYAEDPQGPGGRPAARFVCGTESIDSALSTFGALLTQSHTALMPVLSMEATADDIGGPNPWTLRSAAFVSPSDLDDPVNPKTGARPYLDSHPDRRDAIRACALRKEDVDRHLHALGATYIAGTSTPGYGVIPGGSVHGELQLLRTIGLTPREALAAATSNIAQSFRLPDRGALTAGRRADLVILTADPRASVGAIDSIAEVMVGGRMVDRAKLLAAAALPAPTMFAPGVISGPANDGAPTFTPDGQTLYFERSSDRRVSIFESTRIGTHWSMPPVASFSGSTNDQQPALSPDGRFLIYASSRQKSSASNSAAPPERYNHLFRVDRSASGWSAPAELPAAVNFARLVFKPSIARNGDLYFMAATTSGPDGPMWHLYESAWNGSSYETALPLPFGDSTATDVDPYIAPDESYIIFSSSGRRTPDDKHEHFFVSRRAGSGWGPVQALRYAGDDSGTDDGEANVSPDGALLYFTSDRSSSAHGGTDAWSLPLRALFNANAASAPPG